MPNEYNSIKDLPKATVELDDNMNIKDTFLCVYNDETMNMTDINNLPIHNKYKVDKSVADVEAGFTDKLQENNFIGNIYVVDKNGDVTLGNLKLADVADKLNKYGTTEIGVRYKMTISTGKYTNPGRRVVKRGNKIFYEGIDIEAEGLNIGVAKLDSTLTSEILPGECLATKAFPWNEMKKVQISMDDTEFNYDMTIDNGGNYFTEVPLYYVKTEFLLEREVAITGLNEETVRYEKLADLTSMWDSANPANSIPAPLDTEPDTSIGVYHWVSKYPLDGYRPAQFFVNKVKCIPIESSDLYDNSVQRYVKIIIAGKEYYQKYSNYIETGISSTEVPKLYVLITANATDYCPILESKHYFACYEAALDTYDNKSVVVSKPNLHPQVSMNLSRFRNRVNNLGSNYYIRDIRSHTDFFGHLMDIEYKTLNCQSILNGVSGLYYGNSKIAYFNQTNSDKFILNHSDLTPFVISQTVNIASGYGVQNRRVIIQTSSPLVEGTDFVIEKSGDTPVSYYCTTTDGIRSFGTDSASADDDTVYYKVTIPNVANAIYVIYSVDGTTPTSIPAGLTKEDVITYYEGELYIHGTVALSNRKLSYLKLDSAINTINNNYFIHSVSWKTGSVDMITSRTGVAYSSPTDTKRPFKWNWIENPYANIWKFVDGCHVKHNAIEGLDVVHNAYYVCDIPELYSDTYTGYELITKYYGPSTSSNYLVRLGYDPKYPWAQFPSNWSGGSSSTGYGDYVYHNTTLNSTESRVVLCGGYWSNGAYAGLRCFSLHYGLSYSYFHVGASFERKEK